MNNNEIKNQKKEVPTGIEMNDRDYLNVVLELEKNMSNNYSIALNEASNDYLYEDFFTLLEDAKDAAAQKIEEAKKKAAEELLKKMQ